MVVNAPKNQNQKVTRMRKASMAITDVSGNTAQG